MSANIVNLGSSAHRRSQDLLPWFVMGRLSDEEHASVGAHLQQCTQCRRDLRWHEDMRRAQADGTTTATYDADRAFAALRERLRTETASSSPKHPGATRWQRWPAVMTIRGGAWRAAAALVLGCGVLLGARYMMLPAQHEYHALSSPAMTTPARLVVVFAPQTSEQQMRDVLLASGTRIVDGPTAADAYTLAVAPDHLEPALTRLRAESSVLFVQALDTRDMR